MIASIQKEKAELFLKYHHDKEILVLLNSWDIGSSKLIEASGYKAIATTTPGMSAARMRSEISRAISSNAPRLSNMSSTSSRRFNSRVVYLLVVTGFVIIK